MIEEILNLDSELFLFLNSLGSSNFDSFWIYLSYKESNILFYLSLLIFYFYSKSQKIKLSEVFYSLLFIAIMITITDQTSNLFKDSFQRLRPCYNDSLQDYVRLVKETCGGKYGFFSAHASNSFSLAVFFGLIYRNKYKFIIYITLFYASLISYSRVYLGVHFPLDIFFGSIYGIIIGLVVFKIYKNKLNFFNFLNKS
ncbi:MAG: phosphatase PAP2 family protein [Flavobacteriaceae bacterium]|jgi:undecaprenyl-diphosphatase|nr:phosphatase PAP2 family protein [Flavobacteriales bacterium]MDG1338337.1 phosphatase PAP2 family protein [Flavobacteriaceae bacterium]MDG2499628.1 phosphatase PAP2 family protein [Flavobacteriaceae bacterium]|tara:strand:+ start:53 stop:646 length:594 start_codon:yes stop_codon:yes gene_type:complete